MRTLVLGGTRSGKSARAEDLLATAPQVRYLATGGVPNAGADPAWAARVLAHQTRRDQRYTTVETLALAAELRRAPTVPTLIDDLGNWITGLLDESGWNHQTDLSEPISELADAVRAFDGDLVIVSPETGLSVVPGTAAGRRFQDLLGAANLAVAAACDRVELVVAGQVFRPDATTATPTSATPTSATPAPPAPAPPAPSPASESNVPDTRAPDTAAPEAVAPDIAASPVSGGRADFPLDPIDAELFDTIAPPDEDIAEQTRGHSLNLTKPPGSLGRLEDLAVWIAACQGVCPPRPLTAPQIAVFAGDHGVARQGVSAFPPEVTAQMVANIAGGGAAINVLARRAGAGVQVLDLSVDTEDTDPVIARYKVRRSTGDLRRGQAMTLAEARRSLAAGRAVADQLVDSGADLLIAGEMGIGNTTPAAVLTGTLTEQEPVVVVGRGTGIDDAGWIRKTAAVRDGMRFARPHRDDPLSLLAAVAGPDLAAITGFLAQAALRKTPVILDGTVVTSAALVAELLAPGARAWWCAGHRSTEPAHGFALLELGLEPILDLSMRLGEGSGAAAALPVVTGAVDLMNQMATFGDAGVSGSS
ncbi:nicotinate-nucleotide--dimethylbenzimidazole phosphoribosyltransferase [Gordonia hirsuta DSM 44140 = NBRC 16056]|uniref:Nicotinate-nucleotide--dimethylbenzimidazole phosphoribosyltransferase n=1 Tax=Gordonia hirsuta DSM 44140 = NBRC 16056 TaxID=1121927 RepID=L7L8I8_9ACTN|nr:nicotinate-nucleotide--dimethylbenzimidazole phosphoribosyltransferase [Gordonia hirsuta]GAC57046.1 nicotinate-nucleotide--dimethylbenzimidazole phosphoribosyltransferase [Gordonia hirsuta DSM 44140 = NBRC 16056]